MKDFLVKAGLVGGVLFLIGLAFQTWRIGGLRDQIAEDQAVMDSLNNRVAVADSFAAYVDSAAEVRLAELEGEKEQLESQLAVVGAAKDDAEEELDDVMESLPDTIQERVKSAVESLTAAHAEEARTLAELLAAERESNDLLMGQLEAQRDLNRELQAALAEANVQINFYQNKAVSPFSFNIKADFVKVSLAFASGFILSEVLD